MSINWVELAGFITGGVCVWLVVRENIWNWPIGLANYVFFFVLFWRGRLFADAGLQIIYFGLGVYGWWSWLRGGKRGGALTITRTTRTEWVVLAAAVPLATWGLREALLVAQGAAPFWDSLTTVLSLAAQTLQTRKRLEHWIVWIAADIVYIPLYVTRELPLTAILYSVFLLMCLAGWREWRARIRSAGHV